MLDPNRRGVYLEALRPPPGYRLDGALATTFSLDLPAIVVAPLSFALYDVDDPREALRDPVFVLDAFERYLARITVFVQQGRIRAPASQNKLFARLEPRLVEAASPRGGLFHPKTWFLRFVAAGGDDGAAAEPPPTRFRVLVMSRNLTTDSMWDTCVQLDGRLRQRHNAYGYLNPLGDFLAALPQAAVGELPAGLRGQIDTWQHEIRRTEFEVEAPFESIRFWPTGLTSHAKWPFDEAADRTLIVSPFVSDEALRALTSSRGTTLVSTPDALGKLSPEATASATEVFAFNDAADPHNAPPGADMAESEDGAVGEAGDAEAVPDESVGGDDQRRTLHAKLYIREKGNKASVWTGSANATTAGLPPPPGTRSRWGTNVELLVELTGKGSAIGIDQFLGDDKEDRFRALLVPWRGRPPLTPEEEARERLAQALDSVRNQLLGAGLHMEVRRGDEGTGEDDPADTYDLALAAGRGLDPMAAEVVCWPVSLPRSHGLAITADRLQGGQVVFRHVSLSAVTRLFVFQISGRLAGAGEDAEMAIRFVLNLPASGIPRQRDSAILRAAIGDPDRFVRYLLLLLSGEEPEAPLVVGRGKAGWRAASAPGDSLPLLEEMLRAVARKPEKIEGIQRLIDRLREVDGDDVLPADFDLLWAPILAAWKMHKSRP